VVTTLAGLGGSAVAVDTAGNLYMASGYSIQKATLDGTNWVVTTLAGGADPGSADGTGSDARFADSVGPCDCPHFGPAGVAVDSAGNVYVADGGNSTIRKVTPAGVVTTLAGLAISGNGSADGTGIGARFNHPNGVALDSAGNLYLADTSNNTIRKVTPFGVVTTLAGLAQFDADGNPVGGSADGTGSEARFSYPSGVAVDGAGNVYVADGNGSRGGHRREPVSGVRLRHPKGHAEWRQLGGDDSRVVRRPFPSQ
jgi:sugar lactone lactonase YvrE